MNGCENCTIRKMARESCCTEDVGFGLKQLVNRKTGNTISVCANLFNVDGAWLCGDYNNRAPECKAFECDSLLNRR